MDIPQIAVEGDDAKYVDVHTPAHLFLTVEHVRRAPTDSTPASSQNRRADVWWLLPSIYADAFATFKIMLHVMTVLDMKRFGRRSAPRLKEKAVLTGRRAVKHRSTIS